MQYQKLAKIYEALEKTSKRLEKTFIISKFLRECKREEVREIVYLLQGRVFAQWDDRKIGMSSKLLVKAIASATGEQSEKVEDEWKKKGDLGLVAEALVEKKKQVTLFRKDLSVQKVFDNISKLAELEGEGTVQRKIALVSELLGCAYPLEAKYIVRTIAEDLRAGVGDSMIRDSLMWAFYEPVIGIMIQCGKCNEWNPAVKECLNCQNILEQDFGKNKEKKYGKEIIKFETEKEAREYYNNCMEELQDAFNVANDFGLMAEMLLVHGRKAIEHLELVVGKPIKVMLYPKAKNIEEGFEIVGKPAMLEPKLDGFRVQIHRKKEEIKLYTRNLEEVTIQFPDVVKAVRDNVHSKEFILDSEVVGIDPKTKRVVPFQNISKRIKRKYEVEILVKSLPVVVNVFDVIELNGESLLNQSFEERRKRLKAIIHDEKGKMELIEQVITGDVEKTKKYYQECLEKGHEGIMMKSIQGIYKPGKRVGQGVKIKPVMESLDLVIVGAEWGEGKRANWLSSFIVACKDGDQLKEIGKVGSGLKEKAEEGVSYDELTEELKKNIIQEKGREVKLKPKVVVEIVFEEIQQSPSYSSGYALRFPRILRLREDKGVRDISTLKEIEKIYQEQK